MKGVPRRYILLRAASFFDERIKDLVCFLQVSQGSCLWKGAWVYPAWIVLGVREGYDFEALWQGVRPQGVLPSEERRYRELVERVRIWRDRVDAWRICVPERAREASPEDLVRWKEGLSTILMRILRRGYAGVRAGYRTWQAIRAFFRVLTYPLRARR